MPLEIVQAQPQISAVQFDGTNGAEIVTMLGGVLTFTDETTLQFTALKARPGGVTSLHQFSVPADNWIVWQAVYPQLNTALAVIGDYSSADYADLYGGLGQGVLSPSDQDFDAWTFDPNVASGTFTHTPGVVGLSGLKVASRASVSEVWFVATGSGAATLFVGIYDTLGVRRATSANVGGLLASTGAKAAAIPATVLEPGWYYVAMLFATATTARAVARGVTPQAGAENVGMSRPTLRVSGTGSGLATLPTSFVTGSMDLTGANVWNALR